MTEIETEIPKQSGPSERVLRPGLPSQKNGQERYRVAGGGSVLFRVFIGDQVRIIDIEGQQPSEVVAFSNGSCNVALLGVTATGQGDGLKKILVSKSRSAERLKARLELHQLSLENLHSVDLFVDGSRAGEYTSMSADTDGVVIVSAPGGAMCRMPHAARRMSPTIAVQQRFKHQTDLIRKCLI